MVTFDCIVEDMPRSSQCSNSGIAFHGSIVLIYCQCIFLIFLILLDHTFLHYKFANHYYIYTVIDYSIYIQYSSFVFITYFHSMWIQTSNLLSLILILCPGHLIAVRKILLWTCIFRAPPAIRMAALSTNQMMIVKWQMLRPRYLVV